MKRLIYFELRKIFSRRLAQIALIGVLLFTALLSITTYRNKYAYDPYIGQGSRESGGGNRQSSCGKV